MAGQSGSTGLQLNDNSLRDKRALLIQGLLGGVRGPVVIKSMLSTCVLQHLLVWWETFGRENFYKLVGNENFEDKTS